MSATVITQAQDYLQNYTWGKLWKGVREINPATPTNENLTPLVKAQLLGLKAFLLAGWWQLPDLAKEITATLKPFQHDPLVYFCIYHALMCNADQVGMKALKKSQPAKTPLWMRQWLKLEHLGRSLQNAKQMQLFRTLLKPTNTTKCIKIAPNYAKVALLQTLTHSKADLSFLQQLVEAQQWQTLATIPNPDFLTLMLGVRANKITLEEVQNNLQTNHPKTPLPPYLQLSLANQLYSEGKPAEALACYDQLIPTGFANLQILQRWLMLSVSLPEGEAGFIKRFQFAQNLAPDGVLPQGSLACYALITHWAKGEMQQAYNLVCKYDEFKILPLARASKNEQVFYHYVLNLCSAWQHNQNLYKGNKSAQPLHTLGESHSLTLSNLYLSLANKSYQGKTHFLMGIKMHHLAQPGSSFHAALFNARLNTLPKNSAILLTIGEIDTRPDEGIWQNSYHKGFDYQPVVEKTVHGYVNYLKTTLAKKQPASVTLQGIPAPNYALIKDKDPIDTASFLQMISYTNQTLKEAAQQAGFNFLDVYNATVNQQTKTSHGEWHLDEFHLKPAFYQQTEQWLNNW